MERNVPTSWQNNQENLNVPRKVKHLHVCALRRCTTLGAKSAISYVHHGSFVHTTAKRSSQDTNVIQWFGLWLKPKTFGIQKMKVDVNYKNKTTWFQLLIDEPSVFWTSVGNEHQFDALRNLHQMHSQSWVHLHNTNSITMFIHGEYWIKTNMPIWLLQDCDNFNHKIHKTMS
jgi:hypothetical protein